MIRSQHRRHVGMCFAIDSESMSRTLATMLDDQAIEAILRASIRTTRHFKSSIACLFWWELLHQMLVRNRSTTFSVWREEIAEMMASCPRMPTSKKQIGRHLHALEDLGYITKLDNGGWKDRQMVRPTWRIEVDKLIKLYLQNHEEDKVLFPNEINDNNEGFRIVYAYAKRIGIV